MRIATVIGVIAIALGLLAFLLPGLVSNLPGNAPLVLFGLGAVVLGVGYATNALEEGTWADLPPVEAGYSVPTPGSSFDDAIAIGNERAVRERLRTLAIEVLMETGASRVEANDRIDRGSWTDDLVASAFLARKRLPLSARIRAYLSPKPALELYADRAVAAIETLREDRR